MVQITNRRNGVIIWDRRFDFHITMIRVDAGRWQLFRVGDGIEFVEMISAPDSFAARYAFRYAKSYARGTRAPALFGKHYKFDRRINARMDANA